MNQKIYDELNMNPCLQIESSMNIINLVWSDIRNWDATRINDFWTGKNSQVYTSKLIDTEKYVNTLLEELEKVKNNLKKAENIEENVVSNVNNENIN